MRLLWTAAATLVPLVFVSAASAATLKGTVTDAETGEPLPYANIMVVGSDGVGTTTGDYGSYSLELPAGEHTLEISYLGYKSDLGTVRLGAAMGRHDVDLTSTSVFMEAVVVSASRHAEKVTDAPAAITVISSTEMEAREATTAAEHLASVKGIDYTASGLDTYQISARGMNSTFPRRMLVMTDNRSNLLPGLGIIQWAMLSASSEDIERMEVVNGPASALYGNSAMSGTVLIQTKSPLSYHGLSASLSAGERDSFKGSFRFADTAAEGKLGYKVSVEHFQGHDWELRLPGEPGSPVDSGNWWEAEGGPSDVDFGVETDRFDTRVDYETGDRSRLSFYGGMCEASSIVVTGLGRYQVVDWQTGYAQAQYQDEDWFFQAFATQNNAGETFSLGTGLGIVDNSVGYELEGQNNFDLGDKGSVIWGANYRRLESDSEGSFIPEKKTFDLYGLYGQAEFELSDELKLVGALRYDLHPLSDAQLSPKAGLVFKPSPNHTVRGTINRAYQNPIFTEYYLDLVVSMGLPQCDNNGNVKIVGGAPVLTAPGYAVGNEDLQPEIATGIEFGYQGLWSEKFLVSADLHQTEYDDFISDLLYLNGPYANPEVLGISVPGQLRFDDEGNFEGFNVLGYTNYGPLTVQGMDLAVTYMASRNISIGGTYSYLTSGDVGGVEEEDTYLDIEDDGLVDSPLNAPEHKATLNALYAGDNGWSGSFAMRWVDEFIWSTGVFVGTIESYTLFDGSVSYALSDNIELGVVGTNLLNEEHVEMIGAPELGRRMLGRISYTF